MTTNAKTTIETFKLANLRDLLQQRTEHLAEWIDDLTKAEVVNVTFEDGEVASDTLRGFLFELHGDLQDWAVTLTGTLDEERGRPHVAVTRPARDIATAVRGVVERYDGLCLDVKAERERLIKALNRALASSASGV